MGRSRVTPESFRRDMAAGLRDFAGILSSNVSSTVFNDGAIRQAANECASNMPHGKDSWGYDLSDLNLRIKTPRKTLPCDVGESLVVKVDLKIQGFCSSQLSEMVSCLELNILVMTEDRNMISSWHFDRHIYADGDGEPEEAHPLYHFQYGGKNLQPLQGDHGRILVLTSPRIGHPPMDIVLALDFVLSNFSAKDWKLLRSKSEYVRKVKQAQHRFLFPYMNALGGWWTNGSERDFAATLWPHLI